MNDDRWALENFSGTARLFPLPNLVVFPHVVQPLHVFEPRYRELTADALAGDNLVAMALLQANRKPDDDPPPIHPIVCLGRIIANQVLDDGRYLLLLRGLSRARVVDELPATRPYRMAHLELIPDVLSLALPETQRIRRRLCDLIMPRFSGSEGDKQRLLELFDGELPLGPLLDCLCFQLPLMLERKQEMLEEPDIGARARALVAALNTLLTEGPTTPRKFPPEFSAN